MRDFIVNSNTIKTAPIASRFTFIISAVMVSIRSNERFNEQYPDLMNKGYFTDVDDDTMRLGTFYYAGGIYYILRQWLTEPINKTPQEVAVLMCHFLNVD